MSDKTSDKLLPCPFCGGENIHSTRFNWTPAIMCECGAVMTVQMDFSKNKEAELVRRWNTRKPMKRIVERLENEKGFEVFVFSVSSRNCGNSYKIGYETGINEAIEIVKEEM